MERCLRAVFKASDVAAAHVHRFRHTLATEILSSGGALADVAGILGISESVAENHYAKWNQATQDRSSALVNTRKKKLVVIATILQP
jgi:hypothetical protein